MSDSSISQRFKILHAFYFRGARVQFWLNQRIRPAGICALIATSIASFLCVGQPKGSIFQIFCYSLGLVILTLLWTLLRRAKISAVIETPKYATVGETLRYSVSLNHSHRWKKRGFRLLQIPPDPRPSLREFSQIEEPGEKSRNAFDRTMIYYRWRWLMTRHSSFLSDETEKSFDLAPHKTTKIPMSLTPQQRGVYILNNLRLLMSDPLGFFQKCKSLNPSPARLIVLPKRYRLPHFEMPGSSNFRIGGEETGNSIGNSGEFIGIREYRPGDSMRQIHWKSWAHTGKPMVKELEDTFYPRYALILDTFPGSPDRMVFEEMVSIASSFIAGLDRHDALLDLMFIADDAHTVTAGRGLERTEKLLEVLAAAHIEPTQRFDALSSSVIQHRDHITSSLLILNGWDEARQDFVRKLREAAVPCVPIIVGNQKPSTPIQGYWIDASHPARDLMHLPQKLAAV